jgi:hypothetical protein
MALNTTSTKRLAWQERKAESFTVSPLYCVNATKGFRDSSEYGGRISVATAMAISGAALSPNMGYQSTWAGSFVFSLLNVRLGWWLGNTGIEGETTYRRNAPKSAALPLLQETFGLISNDRKYIYLSDGGHFDNLGLYEMIRRRCRQILVVDAGQDGDFLFDDLSNSIRKIEIDLGISIRFCGLEKLTPRGGERSGDVSYHAMAEIDYPAVDATSEKGLILYVKPAYSGTEGINIRGYANRNSNFPHESTGQQWFGEAQFESYRALGFEIMTSVLAAARTKDPDGQDLKRIFGALWFDLSSQSAAS